MLCFAVWDRLALSLLGIMEFGIRINHLRVTGCRKRIRLSFTSREREAHRRSISRTACLPASCGQASNQCNPLDGFTSLDDIERGLIHLSRRGKTTMDEFWEVCE